MATTSPRTINPLEIGRVSELAPELPWPDEIIDYSEATRKVLGSDYVAVFDNLVRQSGSSQNPKKKRGIFGELNVELTSNDVYVNPFGTQCGGSHEHTRTLLLQKGVGEYTHWMEFRHLSISGSWSGRRDYPHDLSIHIGATTRTEYEPDTLFGKLIGVEFKPVTRTFDVHKEKNVNSPNRKRAFGVGIAILKIL